MKYEMNQSKNKSINNSNELYLNKFIAEFNQITNEPIVCISLAYHLYQAPHLHNDRSNWSAPAPAPAPGAYAQ